MPRRATATSRLPLLRPPSKIGRPALAPAFQAKAPPLKRLPSAGETDPREEGCPRGADVCVGGPKLLLRFEYIGAVDEQLGRKTGGDIFDYALERERHRGGQRPDHGSADEEFQRVSRLRPLELQVRELGLRLREQGLDLPVIERRSDTGIEPQLADFQRAEAGPNGAFR
jgi:hypothetical protein